MFQYKNLKKEAGIYYFKNKINNKYYIGQAINLKKRLRHHFSNIKSNKYSNIALYKAINKYGIENFELDIIEYVNPSLENLKEILDSLEKDYIKKYNSYVPNGYNLTVGGDKGVLGLKMTEEQKNKIIEALKFRPSANMKKIYIWDFINNKEYISISITHAGNNPYIPISRRGLQYILNNSKYLVSGCTAAYSEEDLFNKRDFIKSKLESKELFLYTNKGRFIKGDKRIKHLQNK